jgi:Co/Zn/Cd efflux system component
MVLNVVGVSLFCESYGKGGGDHMILSGVFLDTVADTLASLVVLVSALGRHRQAIHGISQALFINKQKA